MRELKGPAPTGWLARRVLDAQATRRREIGLGLLGLALVAVLLAAAGVVYVLPMGKDTYTAELADADSVKTGDEVRVAGIPVGSVTSLTLEPDHVRMRFTVDHSVFLGDATTLQIRLLTFVGGHYVAVFPAGGKPLGRKVIPPDHVTLPYSLAQTLQDATAPVGGVNGETVRRDMAAARASLRTDPDGLRRIGDALSSLIDTLDRQSTDVSRALTVLDEYVTTVNASRSVLGKLVRRVGLLETVGLNKRAEIKETLKVLGELLARLAGFVPSYEHVLQPIVDKLGESIPALQQLGIRFDGILRSITDIGNRLQRMAGGPVAASSVCVPVPGRAC